ncbi:MAG: glycosyltransferase family 4 protein [Bacteroidales bacterium]|nr:glycosyltransferase family 4 protein [Bacteroidales bacterium]
MRIAYCIHSIHKTGGKERVLSIKANYLADVLGYEVHIITAALKGRKPFFPLSDKVHVHDLRCPDRYVSAHGKYAKTLEKQLLEIRPDITISTGCNEIYCLPALKDGSIKLCEFHFSHDKYIQKYGSSALGRLYAGIRTKNLEKAAAALDCFVVLTEADRKLWAGTVPDARQIYNPLTFTTDTKAALESRRMIAVGRFDPIKNYPDMVRAWAKVHRKHPDWSLDIFGVGGMMEKVRRMIAENGLEGCMNLCGRSSDMRSEMLGRSAMVMSSLGEGFPMVMLEASACGLPIVSYDCKCGPSEIIVDGKSGYVVREGDVDALAEGICRLIESPELRREFGRAAAAKSEEFRIERIMTQWDELFRELIAKH